MIRDQWYPVLMSNEVRKKPVSAMRMGEKMLFWRDKEGVNCIHDRCIHRGVSLSLGKIVNNHIQCPFHGLEYDKTGKCTVIPSNSGCTPVPDNFRVKSYTTAEKHGFIWIYWSDKAGNPDDIEFFDDLDSDFYQYTVKDYWDTHYSRVIENQLDSAHVPFVHHNTIGRGLGKMNDGPLLEWVNDRKFYVYTFIKEDDCTKPKKPEELTRPDVEFKLEFIFPNIWQNHITDKMRIMIAFVPIDDEHTVLYLRFYQKFVRVPLLGQLITRMFMPFNVIVAHQDRRVVNTQTPKASGLKIDENLFQADMPIIQYRKKREELKKSAV